MASPLTHALVGATLAAACHFPWKLWVVGVASALLPDLDAAGYWLGVPYGSFWGHRGFTHSIVFAVLASGLFARWISCWTGMTVVRVWTYCVVAMLSHGCVWVWIPCAVVASLLWWFGRRRRPVSSLE
ncbi:MAG: rane protein [Nitrospira sp.]|nr:rane protein [Nitrospira sp.]